MPFDKSKVPKHERKFWQVHHGTPVPTWAVDTLSAADTEVMYGLLDYKDTNTETYEPFPQGPVFDRWTVLIDYEYVLHDGHAHEMDTEEFERYKAARKKTLQSQRQPVKKVKRYKTKRQPDEPRLASKTVNTRLVQEFLQFLADSADWEHPFREDAKDAPLRRATFMALLGCGLSVPKPRDFDSRVARDYYHRLWDEVFDVACAEDGLDCTFVNPLTRYRVRSDSRIGKVITECVDDWEMMAPKFFHG